MELRSALLQLESRLLQPETRKSGDELLRLLAHSFVEIGSSGRLYDRQQVIEALQREQPAERIISDFAVRQLSPGIAVVTYRVIRRFPTEARESHSLRSSIWQQINGRWQLVFHQGTLVRMD